MLRSRRCRRCRLPPVRTAAEGTRDGGGPGGPAPPGGVRGHRHRGGDTAPHLPLPTGGDPGAQPRTGTRSPPIPPPARWDPRPPPFAQGPVRGDTGTGTGRGGQAGTARVRPRTCRSGRGGTPGLSPAPGPDPPGALRDPAGTEGDTGTGRGHGNPLGDSPAPAASGGGTRGLGPAPGTPGPAGTLARRPSPRAGRGRAGNCGGSCAAAEMELPRGSRARTRHYYEGFVEKRGPRDQVGDTVGTGTGTPGERHRHPRGATPAPPERSLERPSTDTRESPGPRAGNDPRVPSTDSRDRSRRSQAPRDQLPVSPAPSGATACVPGAGSLFLVPVPVPAPGAVSLFPVPGSLFPVPVPGAELSPSLPAGLPAALGRAAGAQTRLLPGTPGPRGTRGPRAGPPGPGPSHGLTRPGPAGGSP